MTCTNTLAGRDRGCQGVRGRCPGGAARPVRVELELRHDGVSEQRDADLHVARPDGEVVDDAPNEVEDHRPVEALDRPRGVDDEHDVGPVAPRCAHCGRG